MFKDKITKLFFNRLFFIFIILTSLIYLNSSIFTKLLNSSHIEINFFTQSLNISGFFIKVKKIYNAFFIASFTIISNYIYSFFKLSTFSSDLNIESDTSNYTSNLNSNLNLLVGKDFFTKKFIYIPEKGLYQNILITGSIGSGKTSSMMYPFTKQLISYENSNLDKKIGMLILDVKGNYYKEVIKYSNMFHRQDDIIIISLDGKYKYNPLDKIDLKPIVLANRLKDILLLFSQNNSDSYWLDKCEEILAECIKLCRLYNERIRNFFRAS